MWQDSTRQQLDDDVFQIYICEKTAIIMTKEHFLHCILIFYVTWIIVTIT